jgi:hypothetical protein
MVTALLFVRLSWQSPDHRPCGAHSSIRAGMTGAIHGLSPNDALQRLPERRELQDVWSRVMASHIAAGLGHQHRLERAACNHDLLFSCGGFRKDFPARRNDATAALRRFFSHQQRVLASSSTIPMATSIFVAFVSEPAASDS